VAVTINLYNHTTARFADGSNSSSDIYKVKLLTTATFNATHTTMSETGGTEVAEANGYITGGAELTGVAVNTVTTNDAQFDADSVAWAASGGSITASYAILYHESDDVPLAFIDFDGSQSADDGTNFTIVWDASGIITFTVA
jgi:hypothetical protein